MLEVPLKRTFRYVHEPVGTAEDAIPLLGDEALTADLHSRIIHSLGGTFLITGFRGVGKSTLVLRTVQQIASRGRSGDVVLPVSLSVARSTTTEGLLFAMVRRIFETVSDSGVLERLPVETGQQLLQAYMRTSLSFKEMQSDARERSAAMDLGAGTGKGVKALTNLITPKLSMTARRTQSLATEASFLAYSETDVEHDLMRIISLLGRDALLRPPRWRRLRRLWPWPRPVPSRLHLVVVLDEVDKLTVDASGQKAVEDLLSGAKNVLTMSGAHFLIVAGPDLHDRALNDAARGNGVYESVFGWHQYVPCNWDAPDLLVADLVEDVADPDVEELQRLVLFLRFKARGVVRRLLQEFYGFVRWEDDAPLLCVDFEDGRRVEFYARLEDILQMYFERGGRRRLFPIPIDEDRWRLSGYYIVDRVLQTDGNPFTAAELLRDGEEDAFDASLRISERNVDRLLDHLAAEGILDIVREMASSVTVIGDVPAAQDKVYRLTEEVRRSLFGLAARHESERFAEVSLAPTSEPGFSTSTMFRSHSRQRSLGGRYTLLHPLGQGGMSTVWSAFDEMLRQKVAVKMIRSSLNGNPDMMARARREIEISLGLRHPHIVRAHAATEDEDGTPALVMELLEGPTLQDLIDERGPLPPPETVGIAHQLADALDYLARRQIVRTDLKPANVIMRGMQPVIIDLGIARVLNESTMITSDGALIGTPAYMAPELLLGDPPDSRSDLYSLGLVMYYCLVGGPLRDGADISQLVATASTRPADLSELRSSPQLREVLTTALALDREDRFPDPAAFREALQSTPEWHDHVSETVVDSDLPTGD